MDDYRKGESGYGGRSRFADQADPPAPADAADAREGDVIQGLRSGLIFSLAIWALLFTVGTIVFS